MGVLASLPPPQKEEERLIAHAAPPIPVPPPNPMEWGNFGAAIGICVLVLNKLWGLFTQQQSSEAQMMVEFMKSADKREERLMRLIEVFLQQKP